MKTMNVKATSASRFKMASSKDNFTLHFTTNGEAYITLTADGRVEFGKNYTPTQAAKAFWEAVAYFNPSSFLREENERLKAEIKALQQEQK